MPGFHIENFGCRALRAMGEAVSGRLRAAGLCERQPSVADVVVVNTCSVTAEADRAAAGLHPPRSPPEPRGAHRGDWLHAQRAPQELAMMAGVSCRSGAKAHKALAPEIILGLWGVRSSTQIAN